MPEYRVEWRQRPLRRGERQPQRVTHVKARTIKQARELAITKIENNHGLAGSELIVSLNNVKRLPNT